MMTRALRTSLLIVFVLGVAGCCCARPASVVRAKPTAEARQIFVDVTTMRIPEGAIEATLGSLRPSADEPRELTREETDLLWQRCQANDQVRVLQAPKVLVLEGQEGSVHIGETIRFARTEVTESNGGLEFAIADGPVFIGYQLKLVATPNESGDRITLELHEVNRAITDGHSQNDIAKMDQKTFEKKAVRAHRLDATFEMKDKGSVLLGNPGIRGDKEGTYLRVTVVRATVLAGEKAALKTNP